ncbi:hypothetical protein DFP72DRAFT_1059283 [Ephemerocybe angulata]|uniref:Uncharacterized protein n=1 Tax=Ephemerocybe angulata TaxID=980116 RepID=A0A8H6MG68_9AGAR|nr:hypothetical protein DFP72DRAFT_1059283 [Tulosesus angulatus]
MSEHIPFNFREPKFVLDLEERFKKHGVSHENTTAAQPRLTQAIPDLRFEYSYMRSLQSFVKITRTEVYEPSRKPVPLEDDSDEGSYEKLDFDSETGQPGEGEVGRNAAATTVSSTEVIEVQWGKVLWITTRDQVISPLIQGALWAIASSYLTPFTWGLGSKLGTAIHKKLPAKEGSASNMAEKLVFWQCRRETFK